MMSCPAVDNGLRCRYLQPGRSTEFIDVPDRCCYGPFDLDRAFFGAARIDDVFVCPLTVLGSKAAGKVTVP